MKVIAPGKLILSGEHAVVYGKPALAMAVNRYVTASITPQETPQISFDLKDLNYASGLTLASLEQLESRIKNKYQHFVQGDFKIQDVLHKPFELAQFASSLCLAVLNIELIQGMCIHVQSTIPMGCGMGSSAATILSIIYAISQYLNMDITKESIYRVGLEAENVQHGTSSGLDLLISLHGGCVYYKDHTTTPRVLPSFPLFLVNTGMPESSTGECVMGVAPSFKSSSLGDDFAAVTDAMDRALNTNPQEMQQVIRENHKLLVKIGVVPERVQKFISQIEQIHGAAKICGAGSVTGDRAGVVLVMTEDEAALQKICEQYQYTILPIAGEARGMHVV